PVLATATAEPLAPCSYLNFAPPVNYPVLQGQQWPPAVGDFNHDNIPDLAVGSSVLLGNGDGTFRPAVNYLPDTYGDAAGDFNEDGNLDLFGGGWVLLGNGDGTFQSPVLYFVGFALNPAVGDFNHD